MKRFSFIISYSSDLLLLMWQRGWFNSKSAPSYWCLKYTHHTPCPCHPGKVHEWLVSSFTCAPISLPCPSSSPRGSVDGDLPRLDWGKGSEYCECKCTCLYLWWDFCFTLFVIQTNTVIVIWQLISHWGMYFLLWEKSEEKSIITQTYFTQTLKRDSIIYYSRHYAQQKVFFLLFFFLKIFLKSNVVLLDTLKLRDLMWNKFSDRTHSVVLWSH